MGIGTIRCHVIDVDDLAVAEAFWSEVTGLPVIGSNVNGRFSYLGQKRPWNHEVILHLVKGRKGDEPNRSHIDIEVTDVDDAIRQVEAVGGRVKKPPSLYPRPGSFAGKVPVIDWAVMRDPFGNEFCLVSDLAPGEIKAVLDAAARSPDGTDTDWRRAAGRAPSAS